MASLVQVVFLIDVNYISKYELEYEVNGNNLHRKLYLCCLRLLTEFGAQTDKDNVRWSFKFYNSSKYKPDISHKIFYDFNLSSLKKFEDELQTACKNIQKPHGGKQDPNRLSLVCSRGASSSGINNNELPNKEGDGSSTRRQYSHSYILNKCLQETLFDYNWDRPDITSPVRDSKNLSSGRSSRNKKNNARKSDIGPEINEDLNFVIVFTHVPRNLEEVSKFIGQNSCSCSSDLIKNIFDSATLQGFIEEKKLRLHLINISKDRLDLPHKSLLQAALNKLFGGIHEIDNLVNDSELKDTSVNVCNELQSIFSSSSEYKVVKGTELGLTSFYWWNRKNISMRGRVPQPGPSLVWEDIDGVSFIKISLELLSVQGSSSKQWEDMYVKGVVKGNALSLLGIGLPSSLLYVCHAPNTVFPTLLSVLSEQNLFMILQLQSGGLVGLAPWVGGVGCLVLFSSTQLTSSLSKFKLINASNMFGLENSLEKGLLMFVKSSIRKVLKDTPQMPEKSEGSTFQRFQPQMLQSWYPCNEIAADNVLLKTKKSKKEVSMLERLQKKYCPQMPRPLSGTHLPPPAMIDVTQPASAAAAPDTPLVKSNVPAAINISKFRVSRAQKLVKNSKIVAAQRKVKEQKAEEEQKAACQRKALEAQNRAQKKSIAIMARTMKKIKNPQDKDELAMALIKLRDEFGETENETATTNASSVDDLHSAAQSIVNLTLRHIKTYFSSSSVEIELREILSKDVLLSSKQIGSLCKEKEQLRQFKLQVLLYLEVLWVLGYPRPNSSTPDKRKSPRKKKKDICEEYTEEILKILRMISLKYDPSTIGEFLRLFVVPNYQDSLGEILVEIFEELNQPLPSTLIPYANNEDEDTNTPAKPLSIKSQVCHSNNAPNSNDTSSKLNKEVSRPQPRRLLRRETSNRQIVVPHVKRGVRRVNTFREKKNEGCVSKDMKSVRRNLFDKGEKLKRSHTIAVFDSSNQKTPNKLNSKKRKRSNTEESPNIPRSVNKSPVTPASKRAKILVPETPYNAVKTTVFNKQRLLKSTGSTVVIESPDIKGERTHTRNVFRRSSLPLSRRTSFYSSGNHSRNFEKGKLQLKLNHIKGPVEKRLSSVSNASDSGDSSFIFSEILNKNCQIESQSRKVSSEKKSTEKENLFQGSLQLKFGFDEEDLEPYRPASGRKMTPPRKRREPESPLLKVRRSLSLVTPVKNERTDFNNDFSSKGSINIKKTKRNSIIEGSCVLNSADDGSLTQNTTPKKLNRKNISIKTTIDDVNTPSRHAAFRTPSKSPAKRTPKKSLIALSDTMYSPSKVIPHIKLNHGTIGKKEVKKSGANSALSKECSVVVTPYKIASKKFNSENVNSINNENIVISQTKEDGSLKNSESENVLNSDLESCKYLTRSKSTESESYHSEFNFVGFSPDDSDHNLSKNTSDIIKECLMENTATPGKKVKFNLNSTPTKLECNSTSKDSRTTKSILKTPQKSPNLNFSKRERILENDGENLVRYTPKCKRLLGLKPSPFLCSPKFILKSYTPPMQKEMSSTIINEMFLNSTPSHFEALLHSPITSLEKNKCTDNKNLKKSATSMMKSHRKLQMPFPSPKKRKFFPSDGLNNELQEVLNSPKKSLMNDCTEFEIVSPLKKGVEATIELVTYDVQDESTIEKVIEVSLQNDEEIEVKEPVVHQEDLLEEVNGSENSCNNLVEFTNRSSVENDNEGEVEDSEAMETLSNNECDLLPSDECDPQTPGEFFLDVENASNTMMTMTKDDLNLVAELLNELDEVNSKNLTEVPDKLENIYRNNSNRGSDSGISVSNPDHIDSNEKEAIDDSIEDVGKFQDNINVIIKSLGSPPKAKSDTHSFENGNTNSDLHVSPKPSNDIEGTDLQLTNNCVLNKDNLNESYEDEMKDDSVVASSDIDEDLEIKEFSNIESNYLCRSIFCNESIYEETNDQQENAELSPEIPLGIKIKDCSVHYKEANQNDSTKRKLFESRSPNNGESVDELEIEVNQNSSTNRKLFESCSPNNGESVDELENEVNLNSSTNRKLLENSSPNNGESVELENEANQNSSTNKKLFESSSTNNGESVDELEIEVNQNSSTNRKVFESCSPNNGESVDELENKVNQNIPTNRKLFESESFCNRKAVDDLETEEINQNVSIKRKLFGNETFHIGESVDELENARDFGFVFKRRKHSERQYSENELSLSMSIKETSTLFNPATKLLCDEVISNTDNNSMCTNENDFAPQIERDVFLNSAAFQSEKSSNMLPENLEIEPNYSEVKNLSSDEDNKSPLSPITSNINISSVDNNKEALEKECNSNFDTNSNSSNLIDVETVFDEPCSSGVDKAGDKFYSSPLKYSEKNHELRNMLTWNSPSSTKKIEPNSNLTPRRSNRKSRQTLFYESPINLEKEYALFSPVFNSRRKHSNKIVKTSRKLYDEENKTDKFGQKDSCHQELQEREPSYKNSIPDKFEFKDPGREVLQGNEHSFKNSISSLPFEDNQSVCNPSSSKPRFSDSFEIISPQKNMKIFEEEDSMGIPEHKKTPIVIRIRKKKKGRRNSTSPKGHRNVTSPKGHRNVTSPKGHRNITSPKDHSNVTSPNGHRNVTSPKGHSNITSPKDHSNVTSPKRQRNITVPKDPSNVTSPNGHRNVTSPKEHRNSTSLRRHSRNATFPKRERNVTSTKGKKPQRVCKLRALDSIKLVSEDSDEAFDE